MTRKAKEKAPEERGPTCGACRHFVRMDCDGDVVGECFFAPPAVQIDEDGYQIIRPILESTERACGRFSGAQ